MVLITLVGKEQAQIGNRFYYIGPLTECRDCRLKGVCFNLEPGHKYEIVKLRDTEHECELISEKVRVVEVAKVPTKALIPKKYAIEGSVITYDDIDCGRLGCKNYEYCHPIGLKKGAKKTVVNNIGKIDCPEFDNLVLVELD